MSTLSARIVEDMKTAMRAKDTVALNVVRALKSAIKYAAIEKHGADSDLDDPDAILVVRREIKKRQDSVQSYESANRQDLADVEKAEIAVLEKYLPAAMNADDSIKLVEGRDRRDRRHDEEGHGPGDEASPGAHRGRRGQQDAERGSFQKASLGSWLIRSWFLVENPTSKTVMKPKNQEPRTRNQTTALIVAAGSSRRMGFDKLAALLLDKPVLQRTIDAFDACAAVDSIIVVGGDAVRERVQSWIDEGSFRKPVSLCAGGAERHLSVHEGLKALFPRRRRSSRCMTAPGR